jgi:hypothetical protein
VGLSPNRGESTSEFKLRIESAIAGKPRVSSTPVPVLVKHDEPERIVVSPDVKMQRSAMLRMSLKKISV